MGLGVDRCPPLRRVCNFNLFGGCHVLPKISTGGVFIGLNPSRNDDSFSASLVTAFEKQSAPWFPKFRISGQESRSLSLRAFRKELKKKPDNGGLSYITSLPDKPSPQLFNQLLRSCSLLHLYGTDDVRARLLDKYGFVERVHCGCGNHL